MTDSPREVEGLCNHYFTLVTEHTSIVPQAPATEDGAMLRLHRERQSSAENACDPLQPAKTSCKLISVRFKHRSDSPLKKKARRGFRGYPAATIAFYGPDNQRASKAAVGIVPAEGAEPAMERLFAEEGDARTDPAIGARILRLLQDHGVKSVIMTDGIIGCPHEEGIDYPDGEVCPQCPFWAHRNRFTGEIEQ